MDRYGKDIDKLNTTDSISTYFKAFEDLLLTFRKLQTLENTYDWKHGQYRWKGDVHEMMQKVEDGRTTGEVSFVNRAYEKLQRDWDNGQRKAQ